jgi:hypothetical protein
MRTSVMDSTLSAVWAAARESAHPVDRGRRPELLEHPPVRLQLHLRRGAVADQPVGPRHQHPDPSGLVRCLQFSPGAPRRAQRNECCGSVALGHRAHAHRLVRIAGSRRVLHASAASTNSVAASRATTSWPASIMIST